MITRLTDPRDVAAALTSPTLVPPAAPPSLLPGPTADLRAAMARFSSGDAHAARRDEVTELLEWFDLGAIEVASTAATTECLVGRVDAMADIARRVPTEVLLHSAGVPDFEYAGLRADVHAMVEVIGRGVPSSPASDVAVERLLERFRRHPAGPVAVVSVLYQSFDATAWLIGTSIVAAHARATRHHAVVQTVRAATEATTIGTLTIDPGAIVELDLASADLEFGAGPHECPGRRVAEVIADGVQAAFRDAGYVVCIDDVVFDDVGRPTVLPMEPAGPGGATSVE